MADDKPIGPAARTVLALAFMAAGVFPILAAFGVGAMHQAGINGPPWIVAAAGGDDRRVGPGAPPVTGPSGGLVARPQTTRMTQTRGSPRRVVASARP